MNSRLSLLLKDKDLRNKVLVIALIFAVFRALASIPIPGVNAQALSALFSSNQLFGLLNIFSGGSLANLSIIMLGLGPYITATIIMQLLTMIFPNLKTMYYEEGSAGRAKFNRYSKYLTIPLAALQGFGFLKLLTQQGVLPQISLSGAVVSVFTIIAGSMVLVWLGDIVSEQKMGNGVSLLIFAGIVAGLPGSIYNALQAYTPSDFMPYAAFVILALVVVAAVVIVNEAERRLTVSYAKQVRGNRIYGGVSSYLPIRVNQAGVIPIIFAISVLLFPQFLGQMISAFSLNWGSAITNWVTNFTNNQLWYGIAYFLLVFIFTYFYTAVTFDPAEISKSLQRSGGFLPGIRPGEPTTQYLSKVVSRVTLFGALFLGAIAVLPIVTQVATGTKTLTIGGTALLIVVAVALDTAKQIDSQLTLREYERS
ncbi:MAG: preprotein translocase subunit SecY [Patescibacteria group bacterium]|nr:preprotein translocase subunit SecY [Patescibacteria group bacterium]